MKLKQYQQEGISFLTNNKTLIPYHSILGDDMGLGKTAQAIIAAERVSAKKILIICPSSVKINWMREILKWTKFKNIFIAGKQGGTPAKDCRIPLDCECVIINYDMCIMPKIKRQLVGMQFDVGILDECHYLINKTSGRTKAILAKGGIIWSCKYKWPMSGTFMKNRNRDTYPILRSLFPHTLGPYTDYRLFAEKFCGGKMGMFGYEDTRSTNTEELGKMIAPIMMRRTKSEVLSELPEVLEQNIYLEVTPEIQNVLYMESEFSDEEKESILNFEMMGQTASYRKELAMAKIKQSISAIEDVLNNVEKVVVFAYHRDFIDAVVEKLEDYGVEVVKGGLTSEEKQKRVDSFVNDKNIRVFVGQIEAAGTGIDGLQFACSNVIFAEIDWVPGTLDQAKARCHRIGQKYQVHIQYLIVPDSLEEAMLNTLKYKKHNIKSVMRQIERVVTKEEKENHMTLEATLERIADALEKQVVLLETTIENGNNQAGSASCEQIEAPTAPKSRSRSRAKAEPTPQAVTTENTVNEVVQTAVENATAQAPALPQTTVAEQMVAPSDPQAPAAPAAAPAQAPKLTLGEIVNKVKLSAGQLMSKVGQVPATTFINEITSQITGKDGARIADCNLDQAGAVLDAIEAKLAETNAVGGI